MAFDIELIERFKTAASMLGAQVFVADSVEDAVAYVLKLVKDRDIKLAVESHSALAAKLDLNKQLEATGVRITDTAIVQWVLKLAQGKDVPFEKVAELVFSAAGEKVEAEPKALLIAARRVLKDIYLNTDLGITEADFGIAETGTLVTLDNKGNARLAVVLPRLHLTLLDASHVAASLSAAADMIKGSSCGIPGHKVPTLIRHLTVRNNKADIPGALFALTREPREEHILIVDVA